jgi:hypothetical protein
MDIGNDIGMDVDVGMDMDIGMDMSISFGNFLTNG